MFETEELYAKAQEYILNIPKFTGKNTIEDTAAFYHYIGEPFETMDIIHVAGTNGKGSVCSYLRSILIEAGFKVGMFTSPHLVSMCERMCYGMQEITKEEFADSCLKVQSAVTAYNKDKNLQYHPSFFEFLFFMSAFWYAKKKPDYMIMETGLGGRLDATNVIHKKALCVITKISFDHMEYLGNTLEEIAGEKAGIMRQGVPTVTYRYPNESVLKLQMEAERQKSPLFFVEPGNISFSKNREKSIDFSTYTRYYGYVNASLQTVAVYQPENAALAVECISELKDRSHILKKHIEEGLRKAHWAGRMEEILPDVFVDGAHNVDGIQAFLRTVQSEERETNSKGHLLFGVVKDKDYCEMIKLIAESNCFSDYTITVIKGKRELDLLTIREIFERYTNQTIVCCDDIAEAFQKCLCSRKSGERLYIAGSLYLVGAIKELV